MSNDVISGQQERHRMLAIWAWKMCILACSCKNITLCNTCCSWQERTFYCLQHLFVFGLHVLLFFTCVPVQCVRAHAPAAEFITRKFIQLISQHGGCAKSLADFSSNIRSPKTMQCPEESMFTLFQSTSFLIDP